MGNCPTIFKKFALALVFSHLSSWEGRRLEQVFPFPGAMVRTEGINLVLPKQKSCLRGKKHAELLWALLLAEILCLLATVFHTRGF